MDVVQSLCCGGRGVNLEEKQACMTFLVSRLLGSNSLRRRICEFVLKKKTLLEEASLEDAPYFNYRWPDEHRRRELHAEIARRLIGKTVISARYVFSRDHEGIELRLHCGGSVVLSGNAKAYHNESTLRTLMWVRPSLAALSGFRVLRVESVGLVNPFVTSPYAELDVLGMPYVTETMEVLRLRGDSDLAFVGGGAFCGGCGEGCPVYSLNLQAFEASGFLSSPRVPFGIFDHFNYRILDEFGSEMFATEEELSGLLSRSPLDESCSEDLHFLLSRLSNMLRPVKHSSEHSMFAIYVGGVAALLPGKKLETPIPQPFVESYLTHVGDKFAECCWSEAGLPEDGILPHCQSSLCWICISNPSCDDFGAVLKFCSACTFSFNAQLLMICSSDIPPNMQPAFVRTLREQPCGGQLLFESDSDMLFGQQCCTIGAGVDHLKSLRASGTQPAQNHFLGAHDNKSNGTSGVEVEESLVEPELHAAGSSVSSEPAAAIDAEEAARISDELWASSVEHVLATSVAPPSSSSPRSPFRLMTFSRHPQALDDVLLRCPLALDLQAQGVDVQPPWANGAKVMAVGVGPELLDTELCPRHVVVLQSDEYLILEALQSLPCNVRPRLKPGAGSAVVPSYLSLMQDASDTGAASSLGYMPDEGSCSGEDLVADGPLAVMPPLEYDVQDMPVRNTFIDFRSPAVSPRSSKTV